MKSLKLEFNDFWDRHETFMIALCKLLKLDYETSTEMDVLRAITFLIYDVDKLK